MTPAEEAVLLIMAGHDAEAVRRQFRFTRRKDISAFATAIVRRWTDQRIRRHKRGRRWKTAASH